MPDVPFTPERDDPDLDPKIIAALQRYDERLIAAGTADMSVIETVENMPPAAEAILDCLQLLERVWPRAPEPERHVSEKPLQLGRFELGKMLGQGGFGIVYLAHDPLLNRPVAVKLPRLHALAHPGLRERFHREARAAAGLDHPHIVPVYEAGEADGVCYIVSAYCPGPSLAEWLKASGTRGIPPRKAAQLILDLADAVAYSHGRSVLHRDIKPGNVLLVPARADVQLSTGGVRATPTSDPGVHFIPRLSDFGLAKLMDDAGSALGADETSASVTMGTPAYMAPEQIAGDDRRNHPAVDVYALGAVFYELLVGRPPFQGAKVVDVLEQVRWIDPQPLRQLRREVPRDLETICLKCLEKSPDRRYGSAADLRDDLRRYLKGEPIIARPPGALGLTLKWVGRHPTAAALCATIALALVAIAALRTRHAGSLEATNQQLQTSLAESRRLEAEAVAMASKLRTHSYHLSLEGAQQALSNNDGTMARAILAEAIPTVKSGADDRGAEWDYLWAQAKGPDPLRVFTHGGRPLHSAAISPDGRVGVTGDEQGAIKVWDLSTGEEVAALEAQDAELQADEGRVAALEFSNDGAYLAMGGSFKQVRIWRTDTWQLEKEFVAHDDTVQTLDFSGGDDQLVTGGRDAKIKIWGWRTGVLRAETKLSGDGDVVVFRARFAPDGQGVVAATTDGRILRWELRGSDEPSMVIQTPDHERLIGSEFCDDGNLLVGAGYGATILTTSTGSPVVTVRAPDVTYSCALSSDGTRAVQGSGHGHVTFIEVGKGMESLQIRRWFGHTDQVAGAAISRDGRRALTTSHDGTAKLWNLEAIPKVGHTLIYSHKGEGQNHIRPVASPNGRWLASVAIVEAGNSLYLDDLSQQAERRILHVNFSNMGVPQFTADGGRIFIREARSLASWDVATGGGPLYEPVPEICDSCLLADGTHVMLAHGREPNFQIGIWDLQSHRMDRNLVGGIPFVHGTALMADRRTLVVASESSFPRLIDLASGKETLLESTFAHKYNYAVPHPFQHRVVLIGEGHKPIWFDVESGDRRSIPIETDGVFQAVAIANDGRLMAAKLHPGSELDAAWNRVGLVDVAANHELYSLFTARLEPTGVTWLPDSRSLAATLRPRLDSDPYLIIWQLSDTTRPTQRSALASYDVVGLPSQPHPRSDWPRERTEFESGGEEEPVAD